MTFTVRIPLLLILLMTLWACAPTQVWTSAPGYRNIQDQAYSARFEPVKGEYAYYSAFKLTVVNLGDDPLEIDWNETRYLYNNRNHGAFVFAGIDPEAVKAKSITSDRIPRSGTLEKVIGPHRFVAWEPIKYSTNDPQRGQISFGPLPAGKNGIYLVIRKGATIIRKKMTVELTVTEVK